MPKVWPDEAYLADVALNIQKLGRAGTDIWGDTIIGIKNYFYWYPPVYLYTLSYWFRLLGFSIYSQRILSIIIGAAFLIILYFYSQTLLQKVSNNKRNLVLMCMMFLIITDNVFLKAVRIGRAEIMVLGFGVLSMYVLQLAQNAKRNKGILFVLTGFLLGISFLTHFFSIIFIVAAGINILLFRESKDLKRNYIFLAIFFLIPISIWLISLYPNYYIFLKQLSLQRYFRILVDPYIESIFKFSSLEQKAIYSIYIILSLIFVLFSFIKRSKQYLAILIMLVCSWAIYIFGKLEWYSVYFVALLYPSTLVLISQSLFTANKKSEILLLLGRSTLFLLALLFILNLIVYFEQFQFNNQHKNIYLNFGEQVKNIIPPKKTVYLSTTPDLYFEFKDRNPLYEFPGVHPKIKEYIDILNDSDYFVINFHLESMFIGNVLYRYIELNQLKEYLVDESGVYKAQIIELKPRNQRSMP